MEARRQDPLGEPYRAPSLSFCETEEGAQTLSVIVDRDPAAVACVPARDRPIDVGDADIGQGNAPSLQPEKETVDRTAATADRVFGPATLVSHPRFKCRYLTGVGVLRSAGLFKQVEEAQPAHRVANESATGFGLCDLVTSAPARARPSPGSGLDPGHAHPIAFAKIEQMNQIGLMSGNVTQCGSPGSGLGTMT